MRLRRVVGICVAVLVCGTVGSDAVRSASPVTLQRDGTLEIAGRKLRCKSVRNVLDRRLPNLGLAGPGILVMNPLLLNRQSDTVRLFVFHHECGHHYVGGSELGADCWAVERGVRDGWLDKKGLGDVCQSFGDAPETATHPSGKRRCRNLDRCFDTSVAKRDRALASGAGRAFHGSTSEGGTAQRPEPKLISGPTLVRNGIVPGQAPRSGFAP